jgi:hypothetical protein
VLWLFQGNAGLAPDLIDISNTWFQQNREMPHDQTHGETSQGDG